MSSNPILITGDLLLGEYSSSLSYLSKYDDSDLENNNLDNIEIEIQSSWFDLTMLCYLGQLLYSLQDKIDHIKINFTGIANNKKKIQVFWDLKFWQLLKANAKESNLICEPDPWNFVDLDFDPSDFTFKASIPQNRINFTPLMHYLINYKENFIEEKVTEWETGLQETFIYKYISQFDLVQSKEYLYLILWELLHNSIIHSNGSLCTFGGQIFFGESSFDLYDKTEKPVDEDRIISSLRKQHDKEIYNCRLPIRKKWLERNKNNSFLLIPIVDNGIGIPTSLRNRYPNLNKSDTELLEYAFTPSVSTGYNDIEQDLFEVHGLSQILELIENYHGYLFLQSCNGRVEYTKEDGFRYYSIENGSALSKGTLFQILLPLNEKRKTSKENERKTKNQIRKVTEHLKLDQKPTTSPNTFFVYEELGENLFNTIKERNNWPHVISNLLQKIENSDSSIIYLDFSFLPRERQFISYLLRMVRKRNMFKGIIVINASPSVMAILHSLRKLDNMEDISHEDSSIILFDRELSSILSRGKVGHCLPLLIPFCSINNRTMEFSIKWIGLSCIRKEFIDPFEFILNKIFDGRRRFSWDEITEIILISDYSNYNVLELLASFRTVCRCNSSLLVYDNHGVELKISEETLSRVSIELLKNKFEKDILPVAKHNKHEDCKDFLYDLPWRSGENRFRLNYYQVWKILNSSVVEDKLNDSMFLFSKKVVDLLIRVAYNELGESIFSADIIMSITPSAGLLGRQVAEYFNLEFIEAPSIYDVNNQEWIPKLIDNKKVIIVNDLYDTGSLTQRMIEQIEKDHSTVLAVLSLLKNKDNQNSIKNLVYVCEVSLGIPSRNQIEAALTRKRYFEIDPYTLDPVHPNSFKLFKDELETEIFKNRLEFLINNQVIFFGHFIHNFHHYNIYFSIVHALKIEGIKEELYKWIHTNIEQIRLEQNSENITIVYPYYSPIFHFISFLKKKGLNVHYLIAKPQAQTNQRLGYVVSKEDINHIIEHAILLDDGIASGGTFSALIEQLLENNVLSITSLVVFDRIGMHPRKHIKKVDSYKNRNGKLVKFRFNSYFSANLRTYYKENCPSCKIIRNIKNVEAKTGVIAHLKNDLIKLMDATNVSSFKCSFSSNHGIKGIREIISFDNAVFSDIPSFLDIVTTISSTHRESFARLDHITTVLSDQKLERQYFNRNQLFETIISLLTDPKLNSHDRIKFILFSTLWIDKKYSLSFVSEILPEVYEKLITNSEELKTITLYFNKYPLEYCAVLIALYNILTAMKLEQSEEPVKDIFIKQFNKWLDVFGTKDSISTSGSIYLFEFIHIISPLFTKNLNDEVDLAWYLMRNFIGSYKDHNESFHTRLNTFVLRLKYQDHESAKLYMSEAMFKTFIDYIRIVSLHFGVFDILTEDELNKIQVCYSDWYKIGQTEKLIDIIYRRIDCTKEAPRSEFRLLLEEITPTVASIYNLAMSDFQTIYPEYAKNVEVYTNTNLERTTCFGQKKFLSKVLLNLLSNPVNYWKEFNNQRTTSELVIKVEINFISNENIIKFRVFDNAGIELNKIKNSMQKSTSGLGGQKQQLNRWNCDLFPEKSGEFTILNLVSPFTERKIMR